MKKVTKKEQAKRQKIALKRANYTKARSTKKTASANPGSRQVKHDDQA